MKTETQFAEPARLHHLVNHITSNLVPDTVRNKCLIINDVPEGIQVNNNEELLSSILSNLIGLVITNAENSHIRITAKLFGNVVLLHVKDDGSLNYDLISSKLTTMQTLAARLGGYVGFTSFRNKLTTIAFSFTNIAHAA